MSFFIERGKHRAGLRVAGALAAAVAASVFVPTSAAAAPADVTATVTTLGWRITATVTNNSRYNVDCLFTGYHDPGGPGTADPLFAITLQPQAWTTASNSVSGDVGVVPPGGYHTWWKCEKPYVAPPPGVFYLPPAPWGTAPMVTRPTAEPSPITLPNCPPPGPVTPCVPQFHPPR